MYVMTPEFGAASQLEKIDMLDFADIIAINKFDRKGAQDALRDVAKQYQRNRELWGEPLERMPVYGTQASRFNDDGVTALYQGLLPMLARLGLPTRPGLLPPAARHSNTGGGGFLRGDRALGDGAVRFLVVGLQARLLDGGLRTDQRNEQDRAEEDAERR